MSGYPAESLRLARRLAYEDALVLLGVPSQEAARRALERYPRLEPRSSSVDGRTVPDSATQHP
jgi:hypothetical protein